MTSLVGGSDGPGTPLQPSVGRAARPAPSRGTRDIYPLPVPVRPEKCYPLSRRSSQRLARKCQIQTKVIEAVEALNWMARQRKEFDAHSFHPDELQQQVLSRIEGLSTSASDLGTLDSIPSPEAALRELLRGRSDYGLDQPTALATCCLERISLPKSLEGAPCALDLLEGKARRFLQCPEQMLRGGFDNEAPFKPYWDPKLRRNQRMYHSFIKKLHRAGYLVFTQKPKAHVGVFFVKKTDEKIRLIIDARGPNQLFQDPPGVDLLSSDGFARTEVLMPAGAVRGSEEYSSFLEAFSLSVGLSDVKDCFHRLRQPMWLSEYFCLLPIRASLLKLEGTYLGGRLLEAGDEIYPCPGSLCMGFSWSLYFAQEINQGLMKMAPSLSISHLAADRERPMTFGANDRTTHPGDLVRHYVYVDNLGILSPDRELVSQALAEVERIFEAKQLLLHAGEIHSRSVKALGVELRGDILAVRITPSRYHKVRQSITGILERKKVSGKLVEVVLGHCTFIGLTNRLLLSVFHTIYAYVRKQYYIPTRLWDSVREELIAFRGLMIFLQSDWARPWNDLVTCSDSSTTGYGVSTAFWPQEVVGECGRVLERTRFKRVGGCDARESALTSAGFVRDSVTGAWVAGDIPSSDYLSKSGWSLDKSFPEIPAQFLAKSLWAPKLWGKWEFDEGILTLEARALVKSLKRIAMSVFGHDVRQLMLVDNMSVCLAFDRSRARNFPLLVQIRRFASYCLARNIQCSVRWVPSELNNSDSPSRYYSDEPSKLLTDAIPRCKQSQEGEDPEGSVPKTEGGGGDTKGQNPQAVRASELLITNAVAEETQSVPGTADSQRLRGFVGPGGRTKFGCGSHPDEEKEEKREQFKQHQFNPQSQGEEDGGQFEGPSSSTIQAHGGPTDGRPEPVPAGEPGGDGEHFEAVFPGAQPVHGLWEAKRTGHQGRGDDGQHDRGIPESDVSTRTSIISGRPPDCSSTPLLPRVREDGSEEVAQDLEGHSWIPEVDAGEEPQGLPLSPLVCHSRGVEETGKAEDVGLSDVIHIDLCSALGIVEGPTLLDGQASFRDHRTLVDATFTRRTRDADQDRRVRHQPDSGLTLPPRMGGPIVRGVEERASRGEVVGFRLWRVQPQLQGSSKAAGGGNHPVPDKTFRAIHRQESQLQIPARSSTSRPVAFQEVSQPLREKCKTGCNLGTTTSGIEESLPTMRSRPWGTSLRPKGAARLSQRAGLNGSRRYFLDLFAGKAGVSKAVQKLGYSARFFDIKNGSEQDLTSRKVQNRIIREIKRKRVFAVMLAPVCTSFSVARDRTKVIRNRQYPWGIPREQLTERESESILLGNRCFRACLRFMRVLDEYKIPYILENPATSKAWYLPPIQSHIQKQHVQFITCDFCQFGTKWKKPTSFICGHVDPLDLTRLHRRCSGRGCCSRTGRPHVQLTGGHHTGIPMTKFAEPYPTSLCTTLSHILTAHVHTADSFSYL